MVFDGDPLIGMLASDKCTFGNKLSVTWSFEPITLKMSSVSCATGNE